LQEILSPGPTLCWFALGIRLKNNSSLMKVLRPYFKRKLELESNLREILPANRKFIRGSTLT